MTAIVDFAIKSPFHAETDLGNLSYITYLAVVLLMTRIFSSVFYIYSMRKTREEFNCSRINA